MFSARETSIIRFAICIGWVGCGLAADRPEIGVSVGYPLTAPFIVQNMPYFNNSYDCGPGHPGQACGSFESAGRRPLLGLSVFIPLTGRLALRVSPLYQRISMGTENVTPFAPPGGVGIDTFVTAANRWELPLSVRWRFTNHINVGLGGTVSTLTGDGTQETSITPAPALGGGYGTSYTTTVYHYDILSHRTIGGATAGVEFPFHTRVGMVAPDVEYTRWASRHYSIQWPANRVKVGIALRF